MSNKENIVLKSREDKLKKLLENDKEIMDAKNIKVVHIKDDVFSVSRNGNVTWFLKENWEVIYSLPPLRNSDKFNQAAYLAWFRESKDSKWVLKLYNIKDINETSWVPNMWAKEINIASIEYFNAWNYIIFYHTKITIEVYKSKDNKWNFHNINKDLAEWFLFSKCLKIKDIESFRSNRQLDKKTYDYALRIIQWQLLDQIWDIRFERIKEEITKQEVDDYFKKWLISKDLHDAAIRKLVAIEKEKQKRLERKKKVKLETNEELRQIEV